MKDKISIVLVHGAWGEGGTWNEVLTKLVDAGYPVYAAQLPLESYAGDVAALNLLLDHVEGPVLLVGFSYAGAVITNAGNHAKVKALAYLTAFAPEAGEVFGAITAMFPAKEHLSLTPDGRGFLWLDTDTAVKKLAHDVPRSLVDQMIAVQKPLHSSLFGSTLETPAWKNKPSSFLVTTDDQVLAAETQHALAKRIGARTEEVSSSHFVYLSKPDFVVQFIKTSAEAITL